MHAHHTSVRVIPLVALSLAFTAATALASGTVRGTVKGIGTAKPVVVFVENMPDRPAKKMPRQRLIQQEQMFKPEVLVLTANTTVEFPNEDTVYHNVFSITPGHEFDLGLYAMGKKSAVAFPTAGEVDVYCNIHPKMTAKMLVLQNEFYAQTTKSGGYTLPELPAGTYTIVAWSPMHEPSRQEVVVKDGGIVTASFDLRLRHK